MPQTYTLPFLGYNAIWKIAGNASALSTAAQINIPSTRGIPTNPDNNQYPGVINATAYPSQRTKGMKTPTCSLQMCYKPSWATNLLFTSLVNTGTGNKTDRFAIAFKDDQSGGLRIWDWGRCNRLQFQQTAMGGPVMVEADFVCRYGDSEAPYGSNDPATGSSYGSAPAFVAPSADAGSLYDDTNTIFTGLGSVRSYTLTFLRGQAPIKYFDGTRYADEIASTMFSGVLSIDQDPGGTAITDTGTATIQWGPATTGTLCSMALVRDDRVYPYDVSIGNMSTRYSIVDLSAGGNPAAFSAGV